jgi:hypothetical protein
MEAGDSTLSTLFDPGIFGVPRLRLRLRSAIRANPADLRAADRNIDLAVAGDLLFEILVEFTLEFANLATPNTGDVDVVARPMTFIKMAVAAQVEQVQLVDQPLPFEQVDGAVNRHTRDVGIDFLGTFQNFVRVQVPASRLHYLKQNPALASETYPARA